MFTYLLLMAMLSSLSVTHLSANNRFDRYDPYTSDHEQPVSRTTPTDTDDEPVEQGGVDPVGDHTFFADDDVSDNHGPLGAICAELAQYCEYFANNMMVTQQQQTQQSSLLVFCHVMELMADLADNEVSSIRAETYAADLIKIITSMRTAFSTDTAFINQSDRFPLISKIMNLETRTASDGTDYDTDLGIYMHNSLRSAETAPLLVAELFSELNAYAQTKSHILFEMFHEDSRQLLILSNKPLEVGDPKRGPYNSETGRHMRQMSWICHHAADACTDLATTLEATHNLSYASPLMKQLNSMLSAMSMTYSHLSAPAGSVRRQDQHVMAQHFAAMIELLPKTSPKRAPHSSLEYTYLDKCSSLRSTEEKEHFVEESFRSELDRDALLDEFFPAFERAVDYNLDGFSSSLATFTTQTLASRFWAPTQRDDES